MTTKTHVVPAHVAIIMDGNGRWAKQRGLPRTEGHRAGAKAVRQAVRAAARLGVRYLTLFCFSTENWQRSPDEVGALMKLFQFSLQSELPELIKNGVRLRAVGDLGRLPESVRVWLERVVEETSRNDRLDLVLAISYGAREEIVHAARTVAEQIARGELQPTEITTEILTSNLWTAGIPDPDLLIRTSGEMRISNFLLWQLAYSEIVVIPDLWPDFTEATLEKCIRDYEQRERRFGLTSEQLKAAG